MHRTDRQEPIIHPSDIHQRIFKWVIPCLKLVKSIPKDSISLVIIHQLAKACTSVGANDQEAVTSSSDKDFVAKYQIAKKELSESVYWLKIIEVLYPDILASTQLIEAQELLKIITTIILNVQNRKP